uniref:Peptidase S74 domain-containing protein n=1 Tax=viral metagenome TaxID=1070528 RepID=A0A6C0JSC5_9ZZZZ
MSVIQNNYFCCGGETGCIGPTGQPGMTGSVGPQGDIGTQGPQGDVGSQGATGPTSPQIWQYTTDPTTLANTLCPDPSFPGVLSPSNFLTSSTSSEGVGTKILLDVLGATGAFRAGYVSSTQWDLINRGAGSVAMGINNIASGIQSVVVGGNNNGATGLNSFVGGGSLSTAGGNSSAITGGSTNIASGDLTFIGGGNINSALQIYDCVVGGHINTANGPQAFVGGGANNGATGLQSYVGGGRRNTASGTLSVVVGGGSASVGQGNTASGDNSAVVGGSRNTTSGTSAFVGGGLLNQALGTRSCIPGGNLNTATGTAGFVSGTNSNDGAINNRFVWGDASGMGTSGYSGPNAALASPNSVWFGCGGAGTSAGAPVFTIFTATGRTNNSTAGVQLVQGGTSWNSLSDVNTKDLHGELDYLDVLDKIDSLPIYAYNYKFNPPTNICRGPTAQDWHARFPSDKNPLMLDTMDLDGITLAALKGLSIQHKDLQQKYNTLQERIEILEKFIINQQ